MTKLYFNSILEKSLVTTENQDSKSKTKSNRILNETKKIDKYFSQQWIKKYFNK